MSRAILQQSEHGIDLFIKRRWVPEGRGAVNSAGLDHYERLVDDDPEAVTTFAQVRSSLLAEDRDGVVDR